MLFYTTNIFMEQEPIAESYFSMFMYKHFESGYHPLFFLSEATIKPRGCWYSYKLPTSYYLINTQIFNWPLSLNFWSQVFRHTPVFTEIPSTVSFKKISSYLLIAPYYFCNFSLLDLWKNVLLSNHTFTYLLSTFKCIRLFENSLFEMQLFFRPYFYNIIVTDWHLKDYIPSEEDWGVSWGQVQRRVFLRWFWSGYWLYLFYDTPWAWRLNYSKDVLNWTWFKDAYYRFFTLYNKANPTFLQFTIFLLCVAYTYSIALDHVLFICTYREILYCWLFNWLYFLCISVLSYFLIARLTNVFLRYIWRNTNLLSYCLRIFIQSPLGRKRFRHFLKSVWFIWAFILTFSIIYCMSPTCIFVLGKVIVWVLHWFTLILERIFIVVLYLPCKLTVSVIVGFVKAVVWITDWYEDDYDYIIYSIICFFKQFARWVAMGLGLVLCLVSYILSIFWPFLYFVIRKYNLAPRFVQTVDLYYSWLTANVLKPLNLFKNKFIPFT